MQDGALETIGKVVNRMAELRTMAADVTKNTSDVENYSKEFRELQSHLNQIRREKFNGISLFSVTGGTSNAGTLNNDTSKEYSFVNSSGRDVFVEYSGSSRTLLTHPQAYQKTVVYHSMLLILPLFCQLVT